MRLRASTAAALLLLAACRAPVTATAQPAGLKDEVAALHRDMVAAFRQGPASVARYYADDATIMGGGMRAVGRTEVDAYWKNFSNQSEWTLEVLEVGGDSQSPWVRGRSILASQGRRMAVDYVGILKRGTDGKLRFYVDIFVSAGGPMMRPPGGAGG